MKSVAEDFAAYRALVIPPEAHATQVLETQRAFYAGAYALLMNLASSLDESVPEEEGLLALEELKAECEAFMRVELAQASSRSLNENPASPPHSIGMDAPTAENDPAGRFRQPMDQSSYNVRHQEIEELLRALARELKARMPKGWGFALFISSFGPQGLKGEGKEGASFYIASVERETMITMLKEFIKRQTQ